ncbi:MAG: type II toxin-antitoxin system VapC family toxin [Pirellulaceae bacterium]
MKYVLDSSVALKWVLAEANADKAIALRDNFRNQLDELHSPDFFLAECGHALFRAERRRLIGAGKASLLLTAIAIDCPVLHSSLALIPRAAAICQQLGTAFYDALYISLAERDGSTFITADAKLVRSVQSHYSFVVDLASLP